MSVGITLIFVSRLKFTQTLLVKFVRPNEKLAKTLRRCFEAPRELSTTSSRCLLSIIRELIDDTNYEVICEGRKCL
jgi:hypothetical protein